MRNRTLLLLAALAAFLLIPAYGADVSGKWTSEFDSQIGHQKYTFEFQVKGNTLIGKAVNAERGETQITEGKVNGDEISFVENIKVEGMELRVEYKGKVSGDEIKLNRKVADFANYDIVAKRAK